VSYHLTHRSRAVRSRWRHLWAPCTPERLCFLVPMPHRGRPRSSRGAPCGHLVTQSQVAMKFLRSTSSLLVLLSMSACAVATMEEPIEDEGEDMDGSGGSGVVAGNGGSGVVMGSGGSLVGSGGDSADSGGAASSGGDTGDGDGDGDASGGSPSTGGATGSGGSSDSCSAPEWQVGQSYPAGGTQVSYNGVTYESCYYVDAGKTPDTNSAASCGGMPWKVVGPC
jgi:hypothetical protein